MRIIEGEYDGPLKGPWSRRRKEQPGPVVNVPGPGSEGMYGTESGHDDRPLQGPWVRRREPVPDPVEADREDIIIRPEKKRDYYTGAPAGAPVAVPEQTPEQTTEIKRPAGAAGENEEKPAPPEQCREPERDRGFTRNLFCPSGIYAGIIMAEILGGRGGRMRRR